MDTEGSDIDYSTKKQCLSFLYLFARSAADNNTGIKNMGLILGFLGFLFLDWVSLCMASNVHNYTFIVS